MANEPNYSSNPSKDEPKKEKVRVIPLEYIDEFPGHPFKVLDDESMQKLMNSIEEIGVQSPMAELRRQMKLCEDIAERCGVIEMVVNEIERGQIAEKKKPAEKKKCEKGIDI